MSLMCATAMQLINVSRFGVIGYGILMGVIAIILSAPSRCCGACSACCDLPRNCMLEACSCAWRHVQQSSSIMA